MVPDSTRRRAVLRSGGALAAVALAGCTSLLGSDEEDDPDAGTDSYGIQLLNETEETHTVSIEVVQLGETDPIFTETAEIAPDEEREWEEVMTGDQQQYRVQASLDANFYDNNNQNLATVDVGTDVSPKIENVTVKIAPYYDLRTVWVNTTLESLH